MADELPTKEGQNIIIKNLNSILMTVVGLSLAALFAYGQNISKQLSEDRVTIQSLQDEIKGLHDDIDDIRNDHDKLSQVVESSHDDSRIRITRLEEWRGFIEEWRKEQPHR